MQIRFKQSLTVLLALFTSISILTLSLDSTAAVTVPDKARIGLFYEATAASSFNVSAERGILVGRLKDGVFDVLYEQPDNGIINIRKDSYYVVTGNETKEYDPAGANIPRGDRIGPFHVQIGGEYENYNAVIEQVMAMKQNGIAAFPAYTGSWYIWTGFYTNREDAQKDIDSNIAGKLGESYCSVVIPSIKCITAVKAESGETLLVYGSDAGVLQIHPRAENDPYIFKLNNSVYRGDLEIRRFTGSDMTVINILPLEQYLYGVVPGEMGKNAQSEALKAQAVVSRTFFTASMGKHKKWDFNLCSTTNCQLYKGYNSENADANRAVDDTKGKIITYNGAVAQVFFFSTSGGSTEYSKNVWKEDIPYLKSVSDKYESPDAPRSKWETTMTADEIKEVIRSNSHDIGKIIGMTITGLTEAGRVLELAVKGTKEQYVFTKSQCRTVLGLGSQLYTITTDADVMMLGYNNKPVKTQLSDKKVMTADGLKPVKAVNNSISITGADMKKKEVKAMPTVYTFSGRGWGHGVGMSQEGAKGMAKAGFKYMNILLHYFPGTRIE